jgi:hypothetical protein
MVYGPVQCPHGQSTEVSKAGKQSKGIQRYQCQNGGRLARLRPPTRRRRARAQNKAEGAGNQMVPPQDTPPRSRLIIGEFGPSDSALAACSDWRLSPPSR